MKNPRLVIKHLLYIPLLVASLFIGDVTCFQESVTLTLMRAPGMKKAKR